jgi:hypothetical protein
MRRYRGACMAVQLFLNFIATLTIKYPNGIYIYKLYKLVIIKMKEKAKNLYMCLTSYGPHFVAAHPLSFCLSRILHITTYI